MLVARARRDDRRRSGTGRRLTLAYMGPPDGPGTLAAMFESKPPTRCCRNEAPRLVQRDSRKHARLGRCSRIRSFPPPLERKFLNTPLGFGQLPAIGMEDNPGFQNRQRGYLTFLASPLPMGAALRGSNKMLLLHYLEGAGNVTYYAIGAPNSPFPERGLVCRDTRKGQRPEAAVRSHRPRGVPHRRVQCGALRRLCGRGSLRAPQVIRRPGAARSDLRFAVRERNLAPRRPQSSRMLRRRWTQEALIRAANSVENGFRYFAQAKTDLDTPSGRSRRPSGQHAHSSRTRALRRRRRPGGDRQGLQLSHRQVQHVAGNGHGGYGRRDQLLCGVLWGQCARVSSVRRREPTPVFPIASCSTDFPIYRGAKISRRCATTRDCPSGSAAPRHRCCFRRSRSPMSNSSSSPPRRSGAPGFTLAWHTRPKRASMSTASMRRRSWVEHSVHGALRQHGIADRPVRPGKKQIWGSRRIIAWIQRKSAGRPAIIMGDWSSSATVLDKMGNPVLGPDGLPAVADVTPETASHSAGRVQRSHSRRLQTTMYALSSGRIPASSTIRTTRASSSRCGTCASTSRIPGEPPIRRNRPSSFFRARSRAVPTWSTEFGIAGPLADTFGFRVSIDAPDGAAEKRPAVHGPRDLSRRRRQDPHWPLAEKWDSLFSRCPRVSSRSVLSAAVQSPKTDTNYTLISPKFGWRLSRRPAGDGTFIVEWRCADCWNKHKEKRPRAARASRRGDRAALRSRNAPSTSRRRRFCSAARCWGNWNRRGTRRSGRWRKTARWTGKTTRRCTGQQWPR